MDISKTREKPKFRFTKDYDPIFSTLIQKKILYYYLYWCDVPYEGKLNASMVCHKWFGVVSEYVDSTLREFTLDDFIRYSSKRGDSSLLKWKEEDVRNKMYTTVYKPKKTIFSLRTHLKSYVCDVEYFVEMLSSLAMTDETMEGLVFYSMGSTLERLELHVISMLEDVDKLCTLMDSTDIIKDLLSKRTAPIELSLCLGKATTLPSLLFHLYPTLFKLVSLDISVNDMCNEDVLDGIIIAGITVLSKLRLRLDVLKTEFNRSIAYQKLAMIAESQEGVHSLDTIEIVQTDMQGVASGFDFELLGVFPYVETLIYINETSSPVCHSLPTFLQSNLSKIRNLILNCDISQFGPSIHSIFMTTKISHYNIHPFSPSEAILGCFENLYITHLTLSLSTATIPLFQAIASTPPPNLTHFSCDVLADFDNETKLMKTLENTISHCRNVTHLTVYNSVGVMPVKQRNSLVTFFQGIHFGRTWLCSCSQFEHLRILGIVPSSFHSLTEQLSIRSRSIPLVTFHVFDQIYKNINCEIKINSKLLSKYNIETIQKGKSSYFYLNSKSSIQSIQYLKDELEKLKIEQA